MLPLYYLSMPFMGQVKILHDVFFCMSQYILVGMLCFCKVLFLIFQSRRNIRGFFIFSYLWLSVLKFIYSEKATKFCEFFTLLLTGTTWDKSKVKISQNFVAFSEYMNFSVKMVVEFEELRTCCRFLTNLFPKIMSQDTN